MLAEGTLVGPLFLATAGPVVKANPPARSAVSRVAATVLICLKDSELSYIASVTAVCKFTEACSRFIKQEELQKGISLFDVAAWTGSEKVARS